MSDNISIFEKALQPDYIWSRINHFGAPAEISMSVKTNAYWRSFYKIRHPKIYLTNDNETLCFKNIYLKTIHRPFNSKWDHVRTISLLRHGRHKKTYGSLVSSVRGAIDHSNGALDCSNEALNHTSVLGRQKNKYFLWCILAVLWILFFFSKKQQQTIQSGKHPKKRFF